MKIKIIILTMIASIGILSDSSTASKKKTDVALYPFEIAKEISKGLHIAGSGLINSNGKIIVKPKYSRINHFSEGLAYFLYVNDKGNISIGYFNTKGKIAIKFDATHGEDFSDGLAMVAKDFAGKKGYINKKGKLVIPMKFDHARPFNQGYAKVAVEVNGKLKMGLIDKKGNYALKPVYDYSGIVSPYSEGLVAMHKDGKMGYLNLKGEWVIKPQYQVANCFRDGYATVGDSSSSSIIDKKGKTILYEYAAALYCVGKHLYKYCKYTGSGYTTGLVNLKGQTVIPAQYSQVVFTPSEGLIAVRKNGLWGFINMKNQLVIKHQFISARKFQNGLSSVILPNRRNAIIDKTGKFIWVQPDPTKITDKQADGLRNPFAN